MSQHKMYNSFLQRVNCLRRVIEFANEGLIEVGCSLNTVVGSQCKCVCTLNHISAILSCQAVVQNIIQQASESGIGEVNHYVTYELK